MRNHQPHSSSNPHHHFHLPSIATASTGGGGGGSGEVVSRESLPSSSSSSATNDNAIIPASNVSLKYEPSDSTDISHVSNTTRQSFMIQRIPRSKSSQKRHLHLKETSDSDGIQNPGDSISSSFARRKENQFPSSSTAATRPQVTIQHDSNSHDSTHFSSPQRRRSSFLTEIPMEILMPSSQQSSAMVLHDESNDNKKSAQSSLIQKVEKNASVPRNEPPSDSLSSEIGEHQITTTHLENTGATSHNITADVTSSDPFKKRKGKYMELHRKHRIKNAFPVELTGGFYNLRFQSLTGNLEKVDDIFEYFTKEATPNGTLVSNGLSALHLACITEQYKVVDYLLIEESNVEMESHSGTPLQIAILRRNTSIMRLLLEKGKANCNKFCETNVEEWTPEKWYRDLELISEDDSPFLETANIDETLEDIQNQPLSKTLPLSKSPKKKSSFKRPLSQMRIRRASPSPSIILKRKSRKSHRRKKTKRKKRKHTRVKYQRRAEIEANTRQYIEHQQETENYFVHSPLPPRQKMPLALCIDINFLAGVEELLRHSNLLLESAPHIEALNRCVYLDRTSIAAVLLKEYKRRYSTATFLQYHQTALQKAVALKKPKMIQVLLSHTNRLDASPFSNLLAESVRGQHMDVLKVILKKGGYSKKFFCKLLLVAVQSDLPAVCELMLKYRVPVEQKNPAGFTALHIATENNLLEVARVLLGHGANTEALSPDQGYTPLHLSVNAHRYEMTKLLLDHDAFIDCEGAYNQKTPLHIATENNDLKLVELLLDYSPNLENSCDTVPPVLHLACIRGFVELVDLFLERGANVNSHYRAGAPLHNLIIAWKSVPNCTIIAKKLIAYRADIEQESSTALTPLQMAVKYECVDIVNALIKLKADVHVLDSNHNSLVHIAAQLASLATLQQLLLMEVWPESRNIHNQAPEDLIPQDAPQAEECRKLLQHYWKIYGYVYRNNREYERRIEISQNPRAVFSNNLDWDHVMSKLKRRLSAALTIGRRSSIPWKLKD